MRGVAIFGATGRMGTAITRLVAGSSSLQVTGALAEAGHPGVGQDAGQLAGIGELGVCITDDLNTALAGCDVAVDFTAVAATALLAAGCAGHGCALVVGTTGLGTEELDALEQASRRVPVVYGRNMSLGVNVLTELVTIAARLLGTEFDAEIIEAHHRHKLDAPSGTALQLGEAVAAARGQQLKDVLVRDRYSSQVPRGAGAVGIASVRGGAVVGDHSVLLIGDEEILELSHRATSRTLFARGAVRAAEWVIGRPAGLYTMRDVLGLAA